MVMGRDNQNNQNNEEEEKKKDQDEMMIIDISKVQSIHNEFVSYWRNGVEVIKGLVSYLIIYHLPSLIPYRGYFQFILISRNEIISPQTSHHTTGYVQLQIP